MPSSQNRNQKSVRAQKIINLGLAALAAQVGFVTLGIVLAAVLGGLWLDKRLGTQLIFTILFVVASAPLSLFIIFRLAMSAISKIKPVVPAHARTAEEEHSSD